MKKTTKWVLSLLLGAIATALIIVWLIYFEFGLPYFFAHHLNAQFFVACAGILALTVLIFRIVVGTVTLLIGLVDNKQLAKKIVTVVSLTVMVGLAIMFWIKFDPYRKNNELVKALSAESLIIDSSRVSKINGKYDVSVEFSRTYSVEDLQNLSEKTINALETKLPVEELYSLKIGLTYKEKEKLNFMTKDYRSGDLYIMYDAPKPLSYTVAQSIPINQIKNESVNLRQS